jgi:hypothetical protein
VIEKGAPNSGKDAAESQVDSGINGVFADDQSTFVGQNKPSEAFGVLLAFQYELLFACHYSNNTFFDSVVLYLDRIGTGQLPLDQELIFVDSDADLQILAELLLEESLILLFAGREQRLDKGFIPLEAPT